MQKPIYNTQVIAIRGREIYENQLRDKLEPENNGMFLLIDIETGEYEIDSNGEVASFRAQTKKPEGVRYGMRIGYRAWGRIGLGGGRSSV